MDGNQPVKTDTGSTPVSLKYAFDENGISIPYPQIDVNKCR